MTLTSGGDSRPRATGVRGTALSVASALIVFSLVGLSAAQSGAQVDPAAHSRQVSRLLSRASIPPATVWLCRPGMSSDPCTSGLTTTVIGASGATSVVHPKDDDASNFDCFYVYPTVSRELSTNADLRVQKTEIAASTSQAAQFSSVCRVWAPMYRQVTLAGLVAAPGLDVGAAATAIAYDSLRAGFEDFLTHFSDGRPIVFIGHSQGSAMLITLISHLVDNNAALRHRVVLAIILGGNVEVPTGLLEGGSFKHIPACNSAGETGCVIAYSSFPSKPPVTSLFGRPGQGVSLQSGETTKRGLQVVCVNPASLGGGSATLDPVFPTEGAISTPWVEYPNLYRANCETNGGATWLQITKSSSTSDRRPVVTEQDGADWGFHVDDVNLALGNLVIDTAAAESSWSHSAK